MGMGTAHLTRFVACLGVVACMATTASAQFGGGGGFNRSVGGIIIDASGAIRTATVAEKMELGRELQKRVAGPQGDIAQAADLRMISLKRLQKAVAETKGGELPESVLFLAGLQRIQYVFVDKENNDIVIGGPAEPWQVQQDGSVVGQKTGQATLRLEDLVVAMQSVESARHEGISCSIEPTPEGHKKLQQFLSRIRLRKGQNPSVYEEGMKNAFGPQMIKLTGIPQDSRYARTLVAADYEMKRLGMKLVESPLRELPSYLDMAKNARQKSSENPRWWMACDYEALTRSEDGMAWKINGRGVKTMTEQDVIGQDGVAKTSGRTNKLAEKWANTMTDNYEALSEKMPIFGDLRNVIDLTLVATLIVQERLDQRAGVDLAVLRESLKPGTFPVPKAVEPQCSFVKGAAGWTVTASGGVDINAFELVENQKVDKSVGEVKTTALASNDANQWWWNR